MHELWRISIVLVQKKCIQIGLLNNKCTILHIKTEKDYTGHSIQLVDSYNTTSKPWCEMYCGVAFCPWEQTLLHIPLGSTGYTCHGWLHRLNTVSSQDAEWQGFGPYLGIRTALHSDPQHHRPSAKLIMQNTAWHEGHILVTKPTLTMHFMFWNIYFKLTLSAALHRGQTSGAEISGDIESPLPGCFVYVPPQHR